MNVELDKKCVRYPRLRITDQLLTLPAVGQTLKRIGGSRAATEFFDPGPLQQGQG